ncbi:hypothetical protein [Hymenobacter cheonanensis]|uniref:hypothetical protein n=1 Tax=Hymenobacter sp. CA2-7 TaxID=3063993 RepID=UPI002712EB47|nr:hypothetical protein [Hymenobacter sp. CA2-7]MDO7887937.1 hypothetical protein [Hymenobacter sp. CA2-7]
METILKALAQHWHLSASQYWQLRLLLAISLVPFLALIYVVLFDKRTRFWGKLRNMNLKSPHPTRLFASSYPPKAGSARA